jgi:hypothetical protein
LPPDALDPPVPPLPPELEPPELALPEPPADSSPPSSELLLLQATISAPRASSVAVKDARGRSGRDIS